MSSEKIWEITGGGEGSHYLFRIKIAMSKKRSLLCLDNKNNRVKKKGIIPP